MNSFLNAIISLSPALLVIMPVAGACFGCGVSRLGLEFNRWAVLSNTLVSCLILCVVMFAPSLRSSNDENEKRPTRLISVSLKLPGTTTNTGTDTETEKAHPRTIHWAIDTTSVWFLLLPTCLWPVMVLISSHITQASRMFYFLLLMLQAFMVGLLVSHDLISFISFLLLTTFCMLCLIRLGSGTRSEIEFKSTMYLQFLGDTFITGGLLLAAVAYSWMQGLLLETSPSLSLQFHALLQGTASDIMQYSLASTYWSTVSPWIFLLILVGFTIKGALFPMHYGLSQWLTITASHSLSKPTPAGWYLVLLALITKICIYGMIRFMIPLNFEVGSHLFSVLAYWGLSGFLVSSLIASLRKNLLQIILWFLIGQTSLTLIILFTASAEIVSSFVLLNVIQGLACCLLLLAVPLLTSEYGNRFRKLLFWTTTLSVLTLIGIPGLGGFTAQFTFLWSLANQNMLHAACYLLGTLLFNLALIRALWLLVKSDRTDTHSDTAQNNDPFNENVGLVWLSISPAVLLILVIGISPAMMMEKTLFPLKEIISSSATNSSEEN